MYVSDQIAELQIFLTYDDPYYKYDIKPKIKKIHSFR